jgi:hypothetical protein
MLDDTITTLWDKSNACMNDIIAQSNFMLTSIAFK